MTESISEIADLYSNKEYCFEELRRARDIFTSKKLFNRRVYDRLMMGFSLMLCHCPLEITNMVDAHITELEMRGFYLPLRGLEESKQNDG